MKMFSKKLFTAGFIVIAAAFGLSACEKASEPVYVHVGPNWKALHQMDDGKASIGVNVKVKKSYQEGEKMQMEISSEAKGKLWILQVDPQDKVSTLLPNPVMKDNNIAPGQTINLPPANANWHIAAEKPYGESLFVFVVTTGEQKLESVLAQAGAGKFKESLQLIQQGPKWGMAKHVVTVKKADK